MDAANQMIRFKGVPIFKKSLNMTRQVRRKYASKQLIADIALAYYFSKTFGRCRVLVIYTLF